MQRTRRVQTIRPISVKSWTPTGHSNTNMWANYVPLFNTTPELLLSEYQGTVTREERSLVQRVTRNGLSMSLWKSKEEYTVTRIPLDDSISRPRKTQEIPLGGRRSQSAQLLEAPYMCGQK